MKNRKGFTLIELLAVIVILAIIALIAVPIVLNMISKARKSAARSSTLGYVDSIEYYAGFQNFSKDTEITGYDVVLPEMTNGQVTCTKTTSGWNSECSAFFEAVDKKAKGDKPKTATIVISSNGKVLSGTSMVYNGYTVSYDGKDATIDGESSNTEPEMLSIDILNSGKITKANMDESHHRSDVRKPYGVTYQAMWIWESTDPSDFYYSDTITVNEGERYKLYGKAAVWYNCAQHERLEIGFSKKSSRFESFKKSQTLSGTFKYDELPIPDDMLLPNLQDFEVTIDEPGEYYIRGTLKLTTNSCSAYSGITELKLEQY